MQQPMATEQITLDLELGLLQKSTLYTLELTFIIIIIDIVDIVIWLISVTKLVQRYFSTVNFCENRTNKADGTVVVFWSQLFHMSVYQLHHWPAAAKWICRLGDRNVCTADCEQARPAGSPPCRCYNSTWHLSTPFKHTHTHRHGHYLGCFEWYFCLMLTKAIKAGKSKHCHHIYYNVTSDIIGWILPSKLCTCLTSLLSTTKSYSNNRQRFYTLVT